MAAHTSLGLLTTAVTAMTRDHVDRMKLSDHRITIVDPADGPWLSKVLYTKVLALDDSISDKVKTMLHAWAFTKVRLDVYVRVDDDMVRFVAMAGRLPAVLPPAAKIDYAATMRERLSKILAPSSPISKSGEHVRCTVGLRRVSEFSDTALHAEFADLVRMIEDALPYKEWRAACHWTVAYNKAEDHLAVEVVAER